MAPLLAPLHAPPARASLLPPDSRLYRRQQRRVQVRGRGDDAQPDVKQAAPPEVQGGATAVGDDAASLLEDDGAGGVVPHLLLVAVWREAQVQLRLAARAHAVLRATSRGEAH